jgi:hypothetical protein
MTEAESTSVNFPTDRRPSDPTSQYDKGAKENIWQTA